jgi:hypothetical protein
MQDAADLQSYTFVTKVTSLPLKIFSSQDPVLQIIFCFRYTKMTNVALTFFSLNVRFLEGDFESYVKKMRKPHAWGGEPELLMCSHVLR